MIGLLAVVAMLAVTSSVLWLQRRKRRDELTDPARPIRLPPGWRPK